MSYPTATPHEEMQKLDRRMVTGLMVLAVVITVIGIVLTALTLNGDRVTGIALAGIGGALTLLISFERLKS